MTSDLQTPLKRLSWACLLLFTLPQVCSAQHWAKRMFEVTSHDFGTVARGAKAEYRFEFHNPYKETIHIADVRSSCGCTTPSISQQTLESFDKAHVLAHFNTRSFLGQKSATVTVVIDEPKYAEVQLSVSGYIRSDVVFDPGEVNLGELDQTEVGEFAVDVNYAGRDTWKIIDVRSANPNFEVELDETQRGGGRVGYRMIVRLKPGAPVGFMQDQLTIVTNDANLENIPLAVEGRVKSPLTVSPAALFLGVLQPGQTVTKRLVVRAKEPFRILDVSCKDGCFQFEKPADEERKLHLISVTFTAKELSGEIEAPIEIQTDIGTGSVTRCKASATVVKHDAH